MNTHQLYARRCIYVAYVGSRVRFHGGVAAGNFSFPHRVHNGSGAHRASYAKGIKYSFPGGKAA
jgi:hypothetical protein